MIQTYNNITNLEIHLSYINSFINFVLEREPFIIYLLNLLRLNFIPGKK